MEMVLQQSLRGPAGMMMSGGAGCRPGPRPAAATAPMMAGTTAKREPETEREMMMKNGGGGEEGGGGDGTEAAELRRGPWTVEEDLTLINYIADHGEGRWNALARAAGLKRTGKSCRLRWLNYLRPDVKRGDFTADEQLLILDLHSRWGNRWSKIAAQLPGRTDNEIKNYWRTRVQKHAKQLNCDVNSARFKDAMRFLWMPRLAERAAAHSSRRSSIAGDDAALTTAAASSSPSYNQQQLEMMMTGGDCSPVSSAVTTNSPSCSSRTSDESAAAAAPGVVGGGDDWAAAAAMQQQGADHEYWSTASALQQLTAGEHQAAVLFHDMMPPLQDLTGWVQGFSEAGVSPPDGLWSLDDMIWRMP